MNVPLLVPAQYGSSDFDFFQALRGYLRFSVVVLCIALLLAILLWNMQPWFELEIKPVRRTQDLPTAENQKLALQRNVAFRNYVVRPGDTLSRIAERYGVGLSTLLQYNAFDNPNVLRAGQRVKIPQS